MGLLSLCEGRLVYPDTKDRNAAIQRAYEAFLTTSKGLRVHAVTREVLLSAARIRALSGHRLPDAIHLATAKTAGSGVFLTNDNDKRIAAVDDLEIVHLSESV